MQFRKTTTTKDYSTDTSVVFSYCAPKKKKKKTADGNQSQSQEDSDHVLPSCPLPIGLCCQSYFGLLEAQGQHISTTVYWSVDCQPGGSLVCGIR